MHIKYRPKTYDEIIGNGYIKNTLQNMELKRPLLFEGEFGTGKTTFAYIIAKEFGAAQENITDLNCVHFSKIEDMRDRLNNLFKSSLFGDKKVLILDEIHELSAKTQEVLLKPLENLPETILVVACTTTTEKVIQGLLDRFVRFRLQKLTDKESKELLDEVIEKENIKLSKLFKLLLIEKSDGIPRRLLTGLAKIKNIKDEEEIRFLLELEGIENLDALEILKLIKAGNQWKIIKNKLNEVLKKNTPESLRVSMMQLITGRIMSDYFKEEETELIKMYDILKNNAGYPEKANLIISLYKMFWRKEI